jgi:hypothetical protein
MRADVDGCGCDAGVFGLVEVLTTAEDDDAPRLGEGCDLRDGDDWPFDLLSSSTKEAFLVLPIATFLQRAVMRITIGL